MKSERELPPRDAACGLVAGIDEVGRGPLAGPVVAAAVILAAGSRIDGLDDSKKLTEKTRNRLAGEIREHALAWSIAWADAAEIDCLNILQATMLAMRRALLGLSVVPDYVRIDGNRLPDLRLSGRQLSGEAVPGGDGKVATISAASIIAKVERDAMMSAWMVFSRAMDLRNTKVMAPPGICAASNGWGHASSIGGVSGRYGCRRTVATAME